MATNIAPPTDEMGTSPWTDLPPPTGQNVGTSAGTQFGGQSTVGAKAGAADYAGVQQFADAANQESRRYLDPQQGFDRRRFEQSMVNKGIDPNSTQGQEMYAQMMRAHGGQDQSAAFGAMQFGQGIQDQMFNQNFQNTQQAGQMQQGLWNQEANRRNNATQRYGMDQDYQLGKGMMEIGRQQQDFNEMMGFDQIDFRDAGFNEGNQRWDQGLAMQMAGFQPPYAGGTGGLAPDGSGSNQPYFDWYKQIRESRGG